MSSIRVPLANNPNAVNSPRRAATASKRPRDQYLQENEDVSPPKKRLNAGTASTSFRRAQRIHEPEGRVFTGQRSYAPSTQFQQRLLAAQERHHTTQEKQPTAQARPEHKTVERQAAPQPLQDKEQISNWRKHYRRVFPDFVIYFDSVPTDVVLKCKRVLSTLGARHEQFFSKDVTHVITTRHVPAQASSRDPRAGIDPSVLSKTSGQQVVRSQQRSTQATQPSLDPRQSTQTNDILQKAQDLDIKIWSLDKFERIVNAIFSRDQPAGQDEPQPRTRREAHASVVPLKREREQDDLSQLLKNEKRTAVVERKPWQEIIPFKQIYLYVHEMDEQVKPVMIREWANPQHKSEGTWPMLRSVSKGRCPFVDEPRQETQGERIRQRRAQQQHEQARAAQEAPRLTRAHTAPSATTNAQQAPRTRSQTRSPEKTALKEAPDSLNQMIRPTVPPINTKGFEPPTLKCQTSASTENMPPLLGSTNAHWKGIPRNPGGEPLASGLQGQNITSAIRSQMYSSTAPSAPGTRVGMSKQQHQMSRKVLEKQSGLSGTSVPSSYNCTDVRAAINNDQNSNVPARRSARQKAESMAQIYEDDENTEEEATTQQQQQKQKAAVKKQKEVKRDPKPGYCENCRDKYEDFYEHITSKKHKKFAASDENWKELDELLSKLVRV